MTNAGLPPLPSPGDRVLDKYRIERVLGQGGAGIVFAAHHELLDQRVALKLLLAEPGSETAGRFVNEAKLAAKIHSAHVCRVMDVGVLEVGIPYIAMEYLEGQDLDAVLSVGAVPLARACDYVLQAIDAVAQAHAQGIVHRDLKPSNLFLAKVPGRDLPMVKVLDFGISKGDMLGADKDVTTSRAILGSPSYMSPEQIKNARTVDIRTDIWSLGVILYELTTGHPPFGGETVGEVFAKILEGEPPPIQSLAPQLPDGFAEVVDRCLRRDREQRYPNVAALADALAPFSDSSSSAELLSTIHGAMSPFAKPDSGSMAARETRAEGSVRDGKASRAATAAGANPSATAAPWIGAASRPDVKRSKKRSRGFLLLLATFIGGGVTVWFLGRAPNLHDNVEALASGAIEGSSSALRPLLPEGFGEAGLQLLTPPSSFAEDAASPGDADVGVGGGGGTDASVDAGGDASDLDGGDDGGADDEDDDDDAPAVVSAGGAAPKAGPSHKPATHKAGPSKKTKKKKPLRR